MVGGQLAEELRLALRVTPDLSHSLPRPKIPAFRLRAIENLSYNTQLQQVGKPRI